jgi:hypothetical protein
MTAKWKQREFALVNSFFQLKQVCDTITAIAQQFGLLGNLNFNRMLLSSFKADIQTNLTNLLMETSMEMDFESVNMSVFSFKLFDRMLSPQSVSVRNDDALCHLFSISVHVGRKVHNFRSPSDEQMQFVSKQSNTFR